jgi:hypothetical protein
VRAVQSWYQIAECWWVTKALLYLPTPPPPNQGRSGEGRPLPE